MFKSSYTNYSALRPLFEKKKTANALEVVISSVGFVRWIQTKGMPYGNKLKNEICIPKWIKTSPLFKKRFLRGLFDTDGCVFIDTHIIKDKKYQHRGWTITSYSAKLRSDIVELLQNLGYSPTLRDSQVSVYMRKSADVERYFREIGTNNKKHFERFKRELTK